MILNILFYTGGIILVLSVIANLYFLLKLPSKEYKKMEKKILLVALFGGFVMILSPILMLLTSLLWFQCPLWCNCIIGVHFYFFRKAVPYFKNYPIAPSNSKLIKLFISTAYSSGSSFEIGYAKPLTIMAFASSSEIPLDIK